MNDSDLVAVYRHQGHIYICLSADFGACRRFYLMGAQHLSDISYSEARQRWPQHTLA